MASENTTISRRSRILHGMAFGVGIALCVFFGFILVCNLVFIVKSYFRSDLPPTVFGITPMIVKSGSMSGTAPDHIEVDDLIFIAKADVGELQPGDIIAFQSNNFIVTHRILAIEANEKGGRFFFTKGDANNIEDENFVVETQIIGKYTGRIPKIGGFIAFLQTPLGIVLLIAILVLGFFALEFSRRCMNRRQNAGAAESGSQGEASKNQ